MINALRKIECLWLPAICAMLSTLLLITDSNERLFVIINQAYRWVDDSMAWDIFWQNMTFMGDSLAIIAILLPLAIRNRSLVWVMLCALISTTIIVQCLKTGFQLPRPLMLLNADDVHVIGSAIHKRSFPSGHTAAAFVLVAVLLRYFDITGGLKAGLLITAILVGVSRVVVSAHWPVDVLVGAGIGWLCGYFSVVFFKHRDAVNAGFYLFVLLFFILSVAYLLVFHASGYPQAKLLQTLLAGISLFLSVMFVRQLYQQDFFREMLEETLGKKRQ